jgi:hypothetical protein
MHKFLLYNKFITCLYHTLKENAEALVAATREIVVELSADKTKYMVMSRDQNAGRNHSVMTSRGWKSLNIWEQL